MFFTMLISIALTLIVSFAILVYPGAAKLPDWFIWASYPIAGLGGGAAIHLILNGVPK